MPFLFTTAFRSNTDAGALDLLQPDLDLGRQVAPGPIDRFEVGKALALSARAGIAARVPDGEYGVGDVLRVTVEGLCAGTIGRYSIERRPVEPHVVEYGQRRVVPEDADGHVAGVVARVRRVGDVVEDAGTQRGVGGGSKVRDAVDGSQRWYHPAVEFCVRDGPELHVQVKRIDEILHGELDEVVPELILVRKVSLVESVAHAAAEPAAAGARVRLSLGRRNGSQRHERYTAEDGFQLGTVFLFHDQSLLSRERRGAAGFRGMRILRPLHRQVNPSEPGPPYWGLTRP